MTYKDLQVHIDNSASCQSRLHAAAKLATAFDAHLTGVFARPQFHLPSYTLSMNAVNMEWLDNLEADYEKAIDAKERDAKQVFDEVISQYQVETLWRSVSGEVHSSLAEEAGYTDLLVLGQPDPDDDANKDMDLPDRILLTAGRPCLVVPYFGIDGNTLGKHPLVAWNGSRESNRALHDALPLLAAAETVTIMLSEASSDSVNNDFPNTQIARYLACHGVKVMTKTIRIKERSCRV